MHSRRDRVSPILSASPTQKPPSHTKGASAVPSARASRAATRKRIAKGVRRVAGVFLVQVWRGFGLKQKTARQGTGSRRGSLHPPRRQGAARPLRPRLRAPPAHRPTLRAPCGTRVDCLRSRLPPRAASLRVVEALRIGRRGGKRSSRHRSSTCKTHLIATQMHPRQAMRVKVRPELPGNFPLRENLSRKFRSFPLDPRCRGDARMASQATAHGGGRKNGAHPPSESLG